MTLTLDFHTGSSIMDVQGIGMTFEVSTGTFAGNPVLFSSIKVLEDNVDVWITNETLNGYLTPICNIQWKTQEWFTGTSLYMIETIAQTKSYELPLGYAIYNYGDGYYTLYETEPLIFTDWTNYTFKVPYSGIYQIDFRLIVIPFVLSYPCVGDYDITLYVEDKWSYQEIGTFDSPSDQIYICFGQGSVCYIPGCCPGGILSSPNIYFTKNDLVHIRMEATFTTSEGSISSTYMGVVCDDIVITPISP